MKKIRTFSLVLLILISISVVPFAVYAEDGCTAMNEMPSGEFDELAFANTSAECFADSGIILEQGQLVTNYKDRGCHIYYTSPYKLEQRGISAGIIECTVNVQLEDKSDIGWAKKNDVRFSSSNTISKNDYEQKYLSHGDTSQLKLEFDGKTACMSFDIEVNDLYMYIISYTIRYYSGNITNVNLNDITMPAGTTTALSAKSYEPSDGYFEMWSCWSSDSRIATITSDGIIQALKPGMCTIFIKLPNGNEYSCNITVTEPENPSLNYKSKTMHKGDRLALMLYSGSNVKWSTSNKKIATVSSDGMVTAKKVGTCKIYAKSGGKTYTCKIKVSYRAANFNAWLWDYDTDDNCFTVEIKNKGAKNLIITRGVCAEDLDYQSFDRKIKLKKKVTIKPGKTRNVKFYVIGRTTWWNEEDFVITFKYSYDGKTSTGYADAEDVEDDDWE